jgi:fido (protein-threonine AMPylation protein)
LPYGLKTRSCRSLFRRALLLDTPASLPGCLRLGRTLPNRPDDQGWKPFLFFRDIRAEMRALFARLRGADFLRGREVTAFTEEVAAFLAYLNAIHPFREGNGRTQLTFTAGLAAQAGHPLELSRLEPASFLWAMIASFFGDEAPLRR